MAAFDRILSGIPGLDRALDNIRLGDNVVWRVSTVDDFRFYVRPYIRQAIADNRNIIYVRFAHHEELVPEQDSVKRYTLDPSEGFEPFTVDVHNIVEKEGRDAFYVFDCLSELQVVWAADLMMGNFFRVTCPYLFELDTVAFFPIIRGRHSFDAIARIRDTTQLLLDAYYDGEVHYVQPLKVWNRFSSTMFLPHQVEANGNLTPLTDGVGIGKFYALLDAEEDQAADQNLDSWERFFSLARLKHNQGMLDDEGYRNMCRFMMTRDERMGALITKHFRAQDYFRVRSRMIGTGTIGGKACGMLLARRLIRASIPDIGSSLEPHDSYYIGSDVFYTYIVTNGCWNLRVQQKTAPGYFTLASELKEKLLSGSFPPKVREQFRAMLEYFGQSPIIVRSSSLLEDSFGNAFAGKYESVFCVNRGTPEQRLETFEQAVRTVYASTMDPSALEYRRRRGLDQMDEQMAILVQRVSGTNYGTFFMPSAAGVGYSYSAYRWRPDIDPSAGMLRIVMGLGTRAVDRTEGDYPRIASLDRPDMTTLTTISQKHRFSQHCVDVLDFESNALVTRKLEELLPHLPEWYKYIVLEHDYEAESRLRERGQWREVCFATCQHLLANKKFTRLMRKILAVLQQEYGVPVDTEFTVNCSENGDFSVNLLQCRPLTTSNGSHSVQIPHLPPETTLFHLQDASMGQSTRRTFDYIIQIDPKGYYNYPYTQKSEVAQAISAINSKLHGGQDVSMLLAPGRIGTSSPELGVPVVFADIANFSVICEVSDSSAGYMPELSYGSHMFQDLVEADIFYAAIFESEKTKRYQPDLLQIYPDVFSQLCPEQPQRIRDLIHVYDVRGCGFTLWFDLMTSQTVCGISQETET
ncbi:MAG: PEP/pyruvate-binding domain-containing protein [Eubacteriales bacterium]|nr:PEP/pyruvate-binding domain-containing protein [Eubacteriales bacterium]